MGRSRTVFGGLTAALVRERHGSNIDLKSRNLRTVNIHLCGATAKSINKKSHSDLHAMGLRGGNGMDCRIKTTLTITNKINISKACTVICICQFSALRKPS